MSDPTRDEQPLRGELGALRSALLELRAPDEEPALRSAARAHAAARSAAREQSSPGPTIFARARSSRLRRAFALAAAAAVAAVAVLVALRAERATRAERAQRTEQAASRAAVSARARDTATPAPAPAGESDQRPAFRPIAFSRSLSAAESYSVVRVRIGLASSAPGAGAPNASIEADLLIGEDGLAHAIRFDSADTLPVYAASRLASGERR